VIFYLIDELALTFSWVRWVSNVAESRRRFGLSPNRGTSA